MQQLSISGFIYSNSPLFSLFTHKNLVILYKNKLHSVKMFFFVITSLYRIGRMETLIGLPFKVLEIPPMRLKKPNFISMPSAMMVYGMILVSYFLVLGGVIYDIIIEPPSIGQV